MDTLITLPQISANSPFSKRHFEQYPPAQYPLYLSITFTKRATDFRQYLKTILDDIPKDKVKYNSNKDIAVTFNCYCHSLESIRPVINEALGHTKMYVRFGLIEDKRIFPDDLWKQGEQVLAKQMMALS